MLKVAALIIAVYASIQPVFAVDTYDRIGNKSTEIDKNCAKTDKNDCKKYGKAELKLASKVEGFYSFRCDVKGWPAVIGEDILVKIDGIEPPDSAGENAAANKFFAEQARKYLSEILSSSKRIELDNIRRGEMFCLVADVIVDSNSLGQILIDKGLAKKFDGKAAVVKDKPKELTAAEKKLLLEKRRAGGKGGAAVLQTSEVETGWLASKNSKVFHTPACRFAKTMNGKNSIRFTSREQALETGRRPCKTCKP